MNNSFADIVIVNWNSERLLLDCVNSIIHSENIEVTNRIFIIDNNSADNSLEILPSHPKIHIVRNDQNFGYARAANIGFKRCTAGYVLLLNPDTRLFPSTIPKCLACMESLPEVDILGCMLFDEKGKITPTCVRFPTPARYFFDATGLSKLFPKIFTPALFMTDWDHTTDRYVDQIIGAFMFIRNEVFQKIGYFDERFFVYDEELDFSKRLADTGGKSFYNASIHAVHIGEGTTKNVKAYRLFLNLKSRLLYSRKYFSTLGYLSVWCSTFLIEPVSRSVFLLVKRKPKEIRDVIKGYAMFLYKKDISKP